MNESIVPTQPGVENYGVRDRIPEQSLEYAQERIESELGMAAMGAAPMVRRMLTSSFPEVKFANKTDFDIVGLDKAVNPTKTYGLPANQNVPAKQIADDYEIAVVTQKWNELVKKNRTNSDYVPPAVRNFFTDNDKFRVEAGLPALSKTEKVESARAYRDMVKIDSMSIEKTLKDLDPKSIAAMHTREELSIAQLQINQFDEYLKKHKFKVIEGGQTKGSSSGPERIQEAAIKDHEGKIWKGPTHFDILADNKKLDLDKPVIDGFVTSTGRFVSREEAMKIVKKIEQQLSTRGHAGVASKRPYLISEDLP